MPPEKTDGDIPSISDVDRAAAAFFTQEDKVLNDIAGNSEFVFRKGESWAINPETGEATYDPGFFTDRGYNPSQSLFAAFHELRCHLVELSEILDQPGGEEEFDQLKKGEQSKKWLHIWENCRQDLKGNRAVLEIAPALANTVSDLYREKLWPENDFTHLPKHLQFIYAVLREGMLPDEQVKVDEIVREEINKLKSVKKGSETSDVISLSTDQYQNPLTALRLSRKFIEPVIEKLYQMDVSENQAQGKSPQDAFGGFYDDYDQNRHPDPMEGQDVEEKVKKTKASRGESSRYKSGYEQESGVKKEDSDEYAKEYKIISPLIAPLRNEVFNRIVEERIAIYRKMVSLQEEGVMVDPGLLVQTHLALEAGEERPATMIDFKGEPIPENVPGALILHLVADQSGSMEGEKAQAQRRAVILVMESLKDFSDQLDEAGGMMHPLLQLDAQTELRGFGVAEEQSAATKSGNGKPTRLYKPLSKTLTEKQRIQFFKGLLDTSGGITNDYDSLAEIEANVRARIKHDPLFADKLKSGKVKEIVIVLSDGDSSNQTEAKRIKANLQSLGVKVLGLGMTKSAEGIIETYSPDGRVCYSINDLPKALQELLADILVNLSIKGIPEEMMELIKAS